MQTVISPTIGTISVFIINKKDRTVKRHICAKNKMAYSGSSVIVNALAGQKDYKITHIYGEHADPTASGYTEGNLNGLSSDYPDTVDDPMRSGLHLTENAESSIIFPSFTSSDSTVYSNNVVTFTATMDSESLNGRILVGLGLVCKIGSIETLFSHEYINAAIKQPGEEMIIHWSVKSVAH